MCPIPNCFGDRAISLYSSKFVKKEILRTVSNTGIYCSSYKVVRFTQYNTFWKIPPSTSIHVATRVRTWPVARLYTVQFSEITVSRKPFGIGHMCIYTFCLEWLIPRPPRILTFPAGTPCIWCGGQCRLCSWPHNQFAPYTSNPFAYNMKSNFGCFSQTSWRKVEPARA
jgi:hypothetical protein